MATVVVPQTEPVLAETARDKRTQVLLEAPIFPLLVKMSWPNILIMLAQASTGLVETWWLSKLGMDALAGMALVFPPMMLMTMYSAGAVGGGISSAVARSLGAGRQDTANALILHAIVINIGLGLIFSVIFLLAGEALYRAMGGADGELRAALVYSNVVFSASVLIWLMNGLASVIRGTGNMWFPAAITCIGVVVLIPLSPVLIFGFGAIPALGVAGGGVALVIYYAAGTMAMLWYILSGRSSVRFHWTSIQAPLMSGIFRVGATSAIVSTLTNLIVGTVTAMVAARYGTAGVAGFGTGARLEYLLIPLIFGVGAPLVALVGANVGAGQNERAIKVGLAGGAIAFVLTEIVGLCAALWPQQWIMLFSADPETVAVGSSYLRIVGPSFGFFGLGLALHFASQGAGRLRWPITAAFVRVTIALGFGWIAMQLTGSIAAIFVALSVSLVAYGLVTVFAVRSGVWFSQARST